MIEINPCPAGDSVLGLRFSSWQPVQDGKQAAQPQPLRIEVDQVFQASHFTGVVVGVLQQARFSSPDYDISGSQAAASLSQHQQRLEYIQRQRERHQCSGGAAHAEPLRSEQQDASGSTHACLIGEERERSACWP